MALIAGSNGPGLRPRRASAVHILEAPKISGSNLTLASEHSDPLENNLLPLRLKEPEALEKLAEEVGRTDQHTGAGANETVGQGWFKVGEVVEANASKGRADNGGK